MHASSMSIRPIRYQGYFDKLTGWRRAELQFDRGAEARLLFWDRSKRVEKVDRLELSVPDFDGSIWYSPIGNWVEYRHPKEGWISFNLDSGKPDSLSWTGDIPNLQQLLGSRLTVSRLRQYLQDLYTYCMNVDARAFARIPFKRLLLRSIGGRLNRAIALDSPLPSPPKGLLLGLEQSR